MRKYLMLYRQTMAISVAAAGTYRANFVLQSIITIISNSLFPLVTLMIYGTGASFEGWNLYEVLLIQAIFTMSTGISGMFFSGVVWATMGHVREGTLEIVLIKPVNCLFYILATTFSIENAGVVLGGLVVFIFAYSHIAGASVLMWLSFLLLFLIGILVMLAMDLLMAATSFKWVANSRIPELYGSVLRFGNYPISIFPKAVKAITSFIIPVAMVGFFPASALLNRADYTMFLAIIPCILFLIIGVKIYGYMVRLYEGVGG